MSTFFRRNFDRKAFFTGTLLIILAIVLDLIVKNVNKIFQSEFINCLIKIFSYNIKIPLLILIFLVIFIPLLINRIYNKFNFLRPRRFKGSNWYTTNNINNPQGASYKELDIGNELFKSVSLTVTPLSEYMRFGIKLLDEESKILSSNSVLTSDINHLLHLSKNIGSDVINGTFYINEKLDINKKEIAQCAVSGKIKMRCEIDSYNHLELFINNTKVYEIVVNPDIRKRICLLAWGDGNAFELNVSNIKVETK